MSPTVHMTHVFTAGPNGGNPAPIVIDADGMSDDQMRQVARDHGHEAGFVLTAPEQFDHALRFWVPNHEMPMCGHATVGALWVLRELGRVTKDRLTLTTPGGVVHARLRDTIEISQPEGVVETVPEIQDILEVLGITAAELAPFPVQNARTARVKTLIPIADVATLDALTPDFGRVQEVCERIGSTGLYPYAPSGDRRFDARQFPRSSGYPEDAATGIAAAALAFGLLDNGLVDRSDRPLRIRQGRAMGHPSEITLRFAPEGLWLGGPVR
ncbi:PhzF family phenazine biosynthesis protein [Kutzneria sp. NPDC052558]|uniref:PhzF family phenazine biosynthesis protein n=1 Tax=Kutzneria sp. NPDC052558 TaxID=3364121 RepID=UPI0037C6892D